MPHLTAAAVRSIKTPGKHGDGHGLFLHILPDGRRYWMYRYQRQGRQRVMSLGNADLVSLADARRLHRGPDRLQDREHVGGGDLADRHLADARQHVVAQRLPPLRRRARVPPSRRVGSDVSLGGLGKAAELCLLPVLRLRLLPVGQRVFAVEQESSLLKMRLNSAVLCLVGRRWAAYRTARRGTISADCGLVVKNCAQDSIRDLRRSSMSDRW
jgi:hypothetical protein